MMKYLHGDNAAPIVHYHFRINSFRSLENQQLFQCKK